MRRDMFVSVAVIGNLLMLIPSLDPSGRRALWLAFALLWVRTAVHNHLSCHALTVGADPVSVPWVFQALHRAQVLVPWPEFHAIHHARPEERSWYFLFGTAHWFLDSLFLKLAGGKEMPIGVLLNVVLFTNPVIFPTLVAIAARMWRWVVLRRWRPQMNNVAPVLALSISLWLLPALRVLMAIIGSLWLLHVSSQSPGQVAQRNNEATPPNQISHWTRPRFWLRDKT